MKYTDEEIAEIEDSLRKRAIELRSQREKQKWKLSLNVVVSAYDLYDVEDIAERMLTAIGNPRLLASRMAFTGHPDEDIEQPLLCECDW